jgi:hypothetical protein
MQHCRHLSKLLSDTKHFRTLPTPVAPFLQCPKYSLDKRGCKATACGPPSWRRSGPPRDLATAVAALFFQAGAKVRSPLGKLCRVRACVCDFTNYELKHEPYRLERTALRFKDSSLTLKHVPEHTFVRGIVVGELLDIYMSLYA